MNKKLLLVLLLGGLAACGGSNDLERRGLMDPVESISQSNCSRLPDKASATALAAATQRLQQQILTLSPENCLRRKRKNTSYLLLKLPEYESSYQLTIDSTVLGASPQRRPKPNVFIVAPVSIKLLDSRLRKTRQFDREDFGFRGVDRLSLDVFVNQQHRRERYLLIESDPNLVGQKIDFVRRGTVLVQGQAYMGNGNWQQTSSKVGFERENIYTYAHNGEIVIKTRLATR